MARLVGVLMGPTNLKCAPHRKDFSSILFKIVAADKNPSADTDIKGIRLQTEVHILFLMLSADDDIK